MKDYALNRGGLTDAAATAYSSMPWSKACREKSAEVIVCLATSLQRCEKTQEASQWQKDRTQPKCNIHKDYCMKDQMQKMSSQGDSCPQKSRPEAKGYAGVQTFMRMVDGCLTTEQPNRNPLLEQILSPSNLNAAYKQVMRNKGAAGIDRMDCASLLGYLLEQKDALTERIRQRTYRPNPVRRVEIPKDNGKKRLLGISTVVDRMIQQAIAQELTPIYEGQFSDGSFGFRPKRGSETVSGSRD